MLTEIFQALLSGLLFMSFAAFGSIMANRPLRVKSMVVLMPACAILCFIIVIQTLVSDLQTILMLNALAVMLTAVILTAFAFLVMEFTRIANPYKPALHIPLIIVPCVVSFAVLTDPWLHLYYSSTGLIIGNGLDISVLVSQPGPFIFLWTVYEYVAGVTFFTVILWHLYKTNEKQLAMLFSLGTSFVVVAGTAGFFFPILETISIDGIALTVAALFIYYSTYNYGFLNLVPTARRKMLDVIEDSIVILDSRGTIEDVNRACIGYLSINPKDLIGRPFSSQFAGIPDLIKRVSQVKEDKTSFELKDPAGRILEANVMDFSYSNAKKVGKMVVLRDVTGRKKLEVENQRVKEEQETLKFQRVESLGLLAAGIAHDFNNSLCSIVNNIEIVKSRIVNDGESEWRL
jgi:PAS domain S-box-containing protein